MYAIRSYYAINSGVFIFCLIGTENANKTPAKVGCIPDFKNNNQIIIPETIIKNFE